MKKLAIALLLLAVPSGAGAQAAATPSPNLSDQQFLAGDPTFQNRVEESLLATCSSIANEAISQSSLSLHVKRQNQCSFMLAPANLSNYKIIVAAMAATDASVIGDATASGTTALTAGNAAAQAALVTDAHIASAISGQFNTLLSVP
jgi:hypothetical protein